MTTILVIIAICLVLVYLAIGAAISGIMLMAAGDSFELKLFLGSMFKWPLWFIGRKGG